MTLQVLVQKLTLRGLLQKIKLCVLLQVPFTEILHCEALYKIYLKGKIGQFYNIGSNKNLNNLEVSKSLLNISKKLIKLGKKVKILFIKDRPGHDVRYALNSNKIKKEIKWRPKTSFKVGLKETFLWYLHNKKYYKYLNKKDILKRLGSHD